MIMNAHHTATKSPWPEISRLIFVARLSSDTRLIILAPAMSALLGAVTFWSRIGKANHGNNIRLESMVKDGYGLLGGSLSSGGRNARRLADGACGARRDPDGAPARRQHSKPSITCASIAAIRWWTSPKAATRGALWCRTTAGRFCPTARCSLRRIKEDFPDGNPLRQVAASRNQDARPLPALSGSIWTPTAGL